MVGVSEGIGTNSLTKGGGVAHFHYKNHSRDREYSSIDRRVLQKNPYKKLLQIVFLEGKEEVITHLKFFPRLVMDLVGVPIVPSPEPYLCYSCM